MNEIALSNDLGQIELEIKHHKNIAGQSMWEIGRRLNHVKDNDLAHGEFINWVENKLDMSRRHASRFMKVANEFPNGTTLSHVGESALYLIATLPEEEREKEHLLESGKTKQVDEMTVRELQEVKRKNREQEQRIKELENREPEIVREEVTKEIVPHDYDGLKSDNIQLEQVNRQLRDELEGIESRNQFIEKNYQNLLEQRAEVDEKSKKYDELTEAIQNAEGKLNNTQKLISDYNKILNKLRKGNETVMQLSGLVYLDIAETVNNSDLVSREFDSLINSLERLTNDLKAMRKKNIIIEGDFENE